MRKFYSLLPLLILLVCGQAWADTFYVSQTGVAQGDGCSLSGATSVAVFNAGTSQFANLDGDTVYLLDTITTAIVVPDGGADAANAVIIRGDYPGHACTLANTAGAISLRVNGKSYVYISGIAISPNHAVANAVGIGIDGATTGVSISSCPIDMSRATAAATYGIASSGAATDPYISGVSISSAVRWSLYWYGAASSGLTVYRTNVNGGYGTSFEKLTGFIYFDYIDIGATNQSPMLLTGVTPTGGSFNNITSRATNGNGIGINDCANMTWNRPWVLGTTGNYSAFSIYGTSHTMTINDGYFTGSKGDGGYTGGNVYNVTWNRCLAEYNGRKDTTTDGDGFTNHTNDYNIFYNFCISRYNYCSGWGIGGKSGTLSGCVAYGNGGNWLVAGTGVDQVRANYYFALTGVDSAGRSWTMRDCIGSGGYPREIYLDAVGEPLVNFDYNCWNPQSGVSLATLDGATSTLWAAYSAREPHSINSDPLFNSNLTLRAGSPCIRTGSTARDAALTGRQTDYFGRSYFYAPYDILNMGADQSGSDAALRPSGRTIFRRATIKAP